MDESMVVVRSGQTGGWKTGVEKERVAESCVRACRFICQRVEEDVAEEIIQPRPRNDFRGRLVKHFAAADLLSVNGYLYIPVPSYLLRLSARPYSVLGHSLKTLFLSRNVVPLARDFH